VGNGLCAKQWRERWVEYVFITIKYVLKIAYLLESSVSVFTSNIGVIILTYIMH
jgi:hypothetical protein